MKKSLIAGVASLAFAATPVLGVFAEAPQASNANGDMVGAHDVTVGNVDETVYSVDINWGDMAFDWKYNSSTGKYEFKSKVSCQINIDGVAAWQVLKEHNNLYTDGECTNLEEGEINSHGPYYQKGIGSGYISVVDSTINGKVKATAAFTPTNEYDWVVGKIGTEPMGIAYDSPIVPLGYDPISDTFSYIESTNGKLAEEGKSQYGYLYLETNNPTGQTNKVTSNDKIGTITITISPDMD